MSQLGSYLSMLVIDSMYSCERALTVPNSTRLIFNFELMRGKFLHPACLLSGHLHLCVKDF